ncbi:hypothetical protein ACOME3_001010 [Neoechinorhynchus agilis]
MSSSITLMTQEQSQKVDDYLMGEGGFSVDQLMELAGLSCAQAISKSYDVLNHREVLIACGPGNNGGDGLVAARHLKLFGYEPVVLYPSLEKSIDKSDLYRRLVVQINQFSIPITSRGRPIGVLVTHLCNRQATNALFGFGFRGPPRQPYSLILEKMRLSSVPIFSIDVPSGWPVDGEPQSETHILPDALISLTAPKLCSIHFSGNHHWLGGRFISNQVKEMFNLDLPDYEGCEQIVELTSQ